MGRYVRRRVQTAGGPCCRGAAGRGAWGTVSLWGVGGDGPVGRYVQACPDGWWTMLSWGGGAWGLGGGKPVGRGGRWACGAVHTEACPDGWWTMLSWGGGAWGAVSLWGVGGDGPLGRYVRRRVQTAGGPCCRGAAGRGGR